MYRGVGTLVDFPGWTTDLPSYSPAITCAEVGGALPPAVQADMAPCLSFTDGLRRWQNPLQLAQAYAQMPCWSAKHVAGVLLPVALLMAFVGGGVAKRRKSR